MIKEAQRSFTYFHLYGYPTDLVVANRVLPDDVGSYFRGRCEAQQRLRPVVEKPFHPIPVKTGAFFDREMVGIDCFASSPRGSSAGRPDHLLLSRAPYEVTRDNGEFLVSVDLPFTDKEQINLSRHADDSSSTSVPGGGHWSCRASSSTPRPRAPASTTARSRFDLAPRHAEGHQMTDQPPPTDLHRRARAPPRRARAAHRAP